MLAFLEHFGIKDDDERVNPDGGAIAIGHPLASSGVRLMTQLARHFEKHPEVRYGLTTMCIGIGMGGSVLWENPHHEAYGTPNGSSNGSSNSKETAARPSRPSRARSSPRHCSGTSSCPAAPAGWR